MMMSWAKHDFGSPVHPDRGCRGNLGQCCANDADRDCVSFLNLLYYYGVQHHLRNTGKSVWHAPGITRHEPRGAVRWWHRLPAYGIELDAYTTVLYGTVCIVIIMPSVPPHAYRHCCGVRFKVSKRQPASQPMAGISIIIAVVRRTVLYMVQFRCELSSAFMFLCATSSQALLVVNGVFPLPSFVTSRLDITA